MSKTVLVTRPEPDATDTAEKLRNAGYHVLLNSLLSVVGTAVPCPIFNIGAIFLTSSTAVRFLTDQPIDRRTPIFTVGKRTRDIALAGGFITVECLGETVINALEKLLLLAKELTRPVLYPSGVHTAYDLESAFAAHGLKLFRWTLYETRYLPLKKDIIDLLYAGRIDWILLYSQRTSVALAREIDRLGLADVTNRVSIACFSAAVAAPLDRLPWKSCRISDRPDAESLMECIAGD